MIFEGPILEKVIEDYIIGKFDKDEFFQWIQVCLITIFVNSWLGVNVIDGLRTAIPRFMRVKYLLGLLVSSISLHENSLNLELSVFKSIVSFQS